MNRLASLFIVCLFVFCGIVTGCSDDTDGTTGTGGASSYTIRYEIEATSVASASVSYTDSTGYPVGPSTVSVFPWGIQFTASTTPVAYAISASAASASGSITVRILKDSVTVAEMTAASAGGFITASTNYTVQ